MLRLLFPLLFASAFSIPQEPSSARPLQLTYISSVGSGCLEPSSIATAAGMGTFTFQYSSFDFELGPDQPNMQLVRRCHVFATLSATLDKPQQVSIAGVQRYASLHLQRSMNAIANATYYFHGNGGQNVNTLTRVQGPYSRTYNVKDMVPDAGLVWSNCLQPDEQGHANFKLHAETAITLETGASRDVAAFGADEGMVAQTMFFKFRDCQ